jgi:tRNA pseudouridine32 synthase/23S rRNA pseudouridine746 synthase
VRELDYKPPSLPIDIIYADDFIIVVNKLSGLLAVPGRGIDKQDCLSLRLQNIFPDALVAHRLDMATSGLMVFARGAEMQRRLSQLFYLHAVEKRYVALVTGKFEVSSGEINLPIAADWPNRPLHKVNFESGKASQTHFRILSSNNTCSRVELEPVTGRTHQLRVHMAAISHSILGDALYGDPVSASCLMLHACSLSFSHPFNNIPLHFVCDPTF